MPDRFLDYLFGSPPKAKLIKLFVHNPGILLPPEEIRRRAQVPGPMVARELRKLIEFGFVRSREVAVKRTGKAASRSRRIKSYQTNTDFPLFGQLKELIAHTSPASREHMITKLRAIGRIKCVVLAGIFVGSETSRADIMIVGEHLSERRLKDFIEKLEAEVGKELTCVALTTNDFQYRYSMFDRFVRDMLDYPHEVLINKLKVKS